MGGKKKHNKPVLKQQVQTQIKKEVPTNQKTNNENKKFVNLLHVYTIYKQKFRRLTKDDYKNLLCSGRKGRQPTIDLCKELMKAKEIPEEIIDFEKNVGFLCQPRLLPLIALLAERAEYKLKPSIVKDVDFSMTPSRVQEKFSHLMVYGFWFLGRVIADSLSEKEQVNRGNVFNFSKGDMGYWWAGVRIMDWNCSVKSEMESESCLAFVIRDRPKFRHFMSRAIFNMHQHPMYFLSDEDWNNYIRTINSIRHKKVVAMSSITTAPEVPSDDESSIWSYNGSSVSDFSNISSGPSIDTQASRESVD